MRVSMVAYFEIFGPDPTTGNFDTWMGMGTREAAGAVGAKVGGFLGYHKRVPGGWAYRVSNLTSRSGIASASGGSVAA
jgi:hypothetical protein